MRAHSVLAPHIPLRVAGQSERPRHAQRLVKRQKVLFTLVAGPQPVSPTLPPVVLVDPVWAGGHVWRAPSLPHTFHSVELASRRDCTTARASLNGRNLLIVESRGRTCGTKVHFHSLRYKLRCEGSAFHFSRSKPILSGKKVWRESAFIGMGISCNLAIKLRFTTLFFILRLAALSFVFAI